MSVRLDGFSPAVAQALVDFIERHRAVSGRKIAAFDADGTLWSGDIGEVFFRDQVAQGTAPRAPKMDPWKVYCDDANGGDAVKAYGWLAQWNAGVREDDLNRWAEEFFAKHWQSRVFAPMQTFVKELHDAGFECWVVSGSIKWVVAAGAKRYGIPFNRVIGTAVTVNGGILTDQIDGVVPYRGGKTVMVDSVIKQRPLFAAGNTYWDKELICTATTLGLSIHSEHPGEPNYDSEQKLQELAREKNWLSQRF